jgi:hypothetical protein
VGSSAKGNNAVALGRGSVDVTANRPFSLAPTNLHQSLTRQAAGDKNDYFSFLTVFSVYCPRI